MTSINVNYGKLLREVRVNEDCSNLASHIVKGSEGEEKGASLVKVGMLKCLAIGSSYTFQQARKHNL